MTAEGRDEPCQRWLTLWLKRLSTPDLLGSLISEEDATSEE
jgi:hypothetical protein